MKIIQSFANLISILEANKTILVIFVDPSMLAPSESLVKYFSFNHIAVQLQQHIYLYKGTQTKMFQYFNILNYPQVTIIKQKPNNILYNFIGCNQEKAWQALGVLAVNIGYSKPHRKLNIQRKVCIKNHELKLINQISQTSYRNGFFMCNGCNMLSHIEIDKPILHCGVCQYDLCNNCAYVETMN